MRPFLVTAALCVLATASSALTPVDVGDPPRTYGHFLNAGEAALCRAGAATGGLESFFRNPACVADVRAVSGQATARVVTTSRDHLGEGAEGLSAEDGAFLLSQVAAVKRSGSWVFGFGYTAPSSRSLRLTGTVGEASGRELYDGTFEGGLRYFEMVFGTRIGRDGRGSIGFASGLVNLTESVREAVGQTLETAEVTGSATSMAAGITYEATDRVTLGAGYRWGTRIGVRGDWYDDVGRTGSSHTQPTIVAGLTVRATKDIALHGCYLNEGWGAATATLSAYEENDGRRDEFDGSVASVALGAEAALMGGKLTLRAGGATRVAPDAADGGMPQWAAGIGGSYRFSGYALDGAVVRERHEVDGMGGTISNYGLYLTVSYDL
ncbi:MAG: hypothetical protein FJY74_07575 [Candidatus Eisenbacteria bacterium]|nr:hypothetical protein [Candidatus Eisenbacteria bacterium]